MTSSGVAPEDVSLLIFEQVGGPTLDVGPLKLDRRLLLGRSPECDLILPDVSVSRRHAVIDSRGPQLYLRDLDSRAGSYINDHKVSGVPAPLNLHDRVRIGPYRFRLRSVGGQVARASRAGRDTPFATQMATPILAAEQRLELIVEFAACAAIAGDLDELLAGTLEFAQRGLNARVVALFSATEPLLAARTLPAECKVGLPDEHLLDLAARGGVVPGRDASDRPTLTAALRLDSEAEWFLHACFDQDDQRLKLEAPEYLHALARLAALSQGDLQRRSIENRVERLQADLESARDVQRRILPADRGRCGSINYALHLHPGRLVSGDLVDVITLPGGRTAVVLGDVAGAGVGAGFLMAGVQAWLHAVLSETGDAARAAHATNAYVARVGGGRFVTCWIGVFDPLQRRIEVIDAGHGHVRLVDHLGSCTDPELRGSIPLGVDPLAAFVVEHLQLPNQSRLVLYSDGVVEQRSPTGQIFGALLLDAILNRSRSPVQDVSALLEGLQLHAGGQPPADDATLLSVAWAALTADDVAIAGN
jgi:serine phosphatase RsbU (regulator of sigma subunit)